jgi:intracellular sulfur oxidation DsrE/DsrF family protein
MEALQMPNPVTNARRSFIGRLASLSAAVGAGFAMPGEAGAGTVFPALGEETHELDKWIDVLKGQHRIVIDSVSPKGATDLGSYAYTYSTVNRTAYGFTDDKSSLILIVRNTAAPFGFNDKVWSTYGVGDVIAFDDPRTKDRAVRNAAGATFVALTGQGAVIAVCGMATQYVAGLIANARSLNVAEVRKMMEANLVPGARIVPSGITTVDRCQRARFSYAFAG